MTATMILKEIHALPAREKSKLFKWLEREREQIEELDDVRLFDEARREVGDEKPVDFRQFSKKNGAEPIKKNRSTRRLVSLPGKWIGERILKSSNLAEEMFAAK
jgi:hypothetical protein